jgi:CheY-like chemotaxis protein
VRVVNSQRTVTILLVDDDDGHAELVQRNLRRAGIDNPVVVLDNGRAALDYVFCSGAYAGREPAAGLLLLLDINMPGIDGIEVLRQLKTNPRTKKIPVVMLTTTDDPRAIDLCYELGCNVYVTKPVAPAAFVEAITRLGLFMSVASIPSAPGRLA